MSDLRSTHRCSVPKLVHSRAYGDKVIHQYDRHGVQSHLLQVAEDQAACGVHDERVCKLPPNVRSTFLMAFSPDKTKVASTHGDHKIYVSDIQTGKCLQSLEGHPRTPWCIAFHPSYNDILASGCLGGEVRVWDLHGGSEVWVSEKNTVIASLAFHPTEKLLVIATFNEIHFWDWSKAEPLAKYKTASEREKVRYIKFDPLGRYLITGIANRSVPGVQRLYQLLYESLPEYQCDEMEQEWRNEMIRAVMAGQIDTRTLVRECQQRQARRQQQNGQNERNLSPSNAAALQQARDYVLQQTLNQILQSAPPPARETGTNNNNSNTTSRNSESFDSTRPFVSEDPNEQALIEDPHSSRMHNNSNNVTLRHPGSHIQDQLRVPANGDDALPPARTNNSNSNATSWNSGSFDSVRVYEYEGMNENVLLDESLPARVHNNNSATVRHSESFDSMRVYGSEGLNEHVPVEELENSTGPENQLLPAFNDTMLILSQTLIYSLRRLHAALQLLTDNHMNDAWSRIPNGRARMLRIVTSILNRLNNLIRNSAATYDSLNMRNEINQEINLMAEQFLQLPPYGMEGSLSSDQMFMNSHSVVELNQRLRDVIANLMHSLERITALEFQYRNLRLMSSAVVSSPMPASSLNWRDERTVTILPNPFSQENIDSSISSRGSTNSSPAVSHATSHVASSSAPLNDGTSGATSSRTTNNSNIIINLRNSSNNCDRRSSFLSASNSSAFTMLRRKTGEGANSATHRLNVDSSNVNSNINRNRNLFRMTNWQSRMMRQIRRNAPFRLSSGSSTQMATSDNFSQSSTNANRNCDTAPAPSTSTDTSEQRDNANDNPHTVTFPNYRGNATNFNRNLADDLSTLESNINSRPIVNTSVGSLNSSADPVSVNRETMSEVGLPEVNVQEDTSNDNFEEVLMNAVLTIDARHANLAQQSSGSTSQSSSQLRSSLPTLNHQSIPTEVRVHSNDNQQDQTSNNSNVSTFRVPRVQIDPVDVDSTEMPQVARPRSPPLGHVMAGNINNLPSHLDVPRFELELENIMSNARLLGEAEASSSQNGNNSSNNSQGNAGFSIGPSHLHANYSRGLSGRILDESTYSRNAHSVVRRAIDRVISGVGSGMAGATLSGEFLTHRIQRWNFSYPFLADISSATESVVVPECKIHNDASVDIASDGTILAALVPVHRNNMQVCDGTMLGIYSLQQETLGQCLHVWSFGTEAITVSLSPLARYVMVGLASGRVTSSHFNRLAPPNMSIILKVEWNSDKNELIFIRYLKHSGYVSGRQYVSLNAACWLPDPGDGIIFGTNRGDLRILYPRYGGAVYAEVKTKSFKLGPVLNRSQASSAQPSQLAARPIQVMSATTSTQTAQPDTHTIATQTNPDYS